MPTNEGQIEVAVYYDTPQEREFAEKTMKADAPSQEVRVYDGVVEGLISTSNRSVLRKHGLLIETLSSPPPATETEEAVPPPMMAMEAASTEDDAQPTLASATVRRESPPRRSRKSAAAALGSSSRSNETLTRQLNRFRERANSSAAEDIKSKFRSKRRAPTRDLSRSARKRGRSAPETTASEDLPPFPESVEASPAAVGMSVDQKSTEDVYEVQLSGPMRPEWQRSLRDEGLEICSFAPPNSYRMFLTDDEVGLVNSLPFVKSIKRYGLGATVTPDLLQALESAEQRSNAADDPTAVVAATMLSSVEPAPTPQIFEIVCHRPEDLQKVIALIVEEGGEVLDSSQDTVRFKTPIESSLLPALADLSEVKTLAPYKAPTLFSNLCRILIGIDAVAETGPQHYTGAGEVIGVFDSGIDPDHPDLAGRIKEAIKFKNCSAIDQVGHGTHVAGIIAGTGAASADDRICGVAPGAELIVVGIVKPDGTLELPVDLGELLREAVDRGAKIINLSWGTPIGGAYDQGSASVDKFVYENPEILVVVAAGNSGTAPEGLPKFNTIGTPASAKNIITVGASATDRVGIARNTWNLLKPTLFQAPPTSEMLTAGNPDLPAAISSRGPTDFDSVKPDVLAPGTFVLSARSKNFTAALSWEDYPEHDNLYTYIGGTSMAAPMVAGAAAVIREYLRTARDTPRPSAALLKAILIASAKRLPPIDPELDEVVGYPDFDQGYGRVDLRNVLPYPEAPATRKFVFADVRNDSAEALQSRMPLGAARKSSRTYTVKVRAGATQPLIAVLTWTDRPGSGVMNNLQLDIRGPGGFVTVGNPQHRFRKDPRFDDASAEGLAFDKRNNVEMVRIEPAELHEGTYRVRVVAQNTAFPPQGYAICVCGELDSDLVAE